MAAQLTLDEVPLTALRTGALWASFLHVQAPWIAAGVTRWLDLVRSDGPWPVFVVAAQRPEQPETLLGTIVGVWAPAPVSRFDDLLDNVAPRGLRGADRPSDGVWHFIAATVDPAAEGMNLGRQLVGAALTWMETNTGPDALARTLSPAVGLPELAAWVADMPDPIHAAIYGLANAKGQPALEILRLHLGAGARLDAVLRESRGDEVRSGRVTLRFAYDRAADHRQAQADAYRAWIAGRVLAGGVPRGPWLWVGESTP